MPRKLALLLTLTAWIFSTGAQWDVLQTFAWGRMFVTYSQAMPLLSAAKKTFSREATCNLCTVVQQAREHSSQNQAPAPGNKAPSKMILVVADIASPWVAPLCQSVVLTNEAVFGSSSEPVAPPSPPPRRSA
jgi:hypothetical protein